MSSVTCSPAIDAKELASLNRATIQCIDVRSPSEFASGHIPGAVNVPMDEIESRLDDLLPGRPAILVCQAGKRASMTYAMLADRASDLAVLSGGTDAWKAAGYPLVASTRTRWALERQVRLIAGVLVLTGVTLGFLVNSAWFFLAGFVGLGLTVAGTTNFCGMAYLLALLPRNKTGSNMKGCACSSNSKA